MKTIDKTINKEIESEDFMMNEQTPSFIQDFDILSSIAIGSYYVLDLQRKKICYVKPGSLFLCNYSVEDALKMRYDFYSKVIYPEDISLWTDICSILSWTIVMIL